MDVMSAPGPCSRNGEEGVRAEGSSIAEGGCERRRYEAGLLLLMRFTSTPRKAEGAQQAMDHGLI